MEPVEPTHNGRSVRQSDQLNGEQDLRGLKIKPPEPLYHCFCTREEGLDRKACWFISTGRIDRDLYPKNSSDGVLVRILETDGACVIHTPQRLF